MSDIIECSTEGCGATASIEDLKRSNPGWGWWKFDGTIIHECPVCSACPACGLIECEDDSCE